MTAAITFTLERIVAEDGVELCGLFGPSNSGSDKAVLHIHGLAGNFYEQLFVDEICLRSEAAQRRVLLLNTRGHDYFSDAIIRSDEGKTTLDRGGAHERLSEAILDLEAAITFLKKRGITDLIITAHSTGAVKVALYLLKHKHSIVSSAIFISPSDDVGIQLSYAGSRFNELLALARNMVTKGEAEALMPEASFVYPVDAQAYIELFDPAGEGNVFDFSGIGSGLSCLRSIAIPIFVIFGSQDIAVVEDNKLDAASRLVSNLASAARSRAEVIDGAGHDYAGFEGALGDLLSSWFAHDHTAVVQN